MDKCPIGLVECKYTKNCIKTCDVCIRKQQRDELESMLLGVEIKSYNQALEDFSNKLKSKIKEHKEWSEGDEEYIYTYYTDKLTFTDIEEMTEELMR